MSDLLAVAGVLLGNRSLFHLDIKGAGALHRVLRLEGEEGLSRLFEFTVDAAGPELELRTLVARPATLTIDGLEAARHVHGLVSRAEHHGHSRHYRLYRLTLSPALWRLRHRHDCRIFQQATTPEILKRVFAAAGLMTCDIRFDLQAAYAPRDYCVQYRENDFDFVSRLMEEDGMFYFFEHDEEHTRLVVADNPSAHKPIAGPSTVAYNEGGAVRGQEHITAMRLGECVGAGKVSLRDYNFHSPAQAMEVAAVGAANMDLEVYDYPGEFQSPTTGAPHLGATIAKIRLESLQASRREGTGTSDSPRVVPGRIFTLAAHPCGEINGEYLVTGVKHHGSQPQALDMDGEGEFRYENGFTVIPRSTVFRPPRVTPRPIMRGVQSATVVGPGTEEVFPDEQGRVFVQFHWDRQGQHDDMSSCWVRVSQPWAGNGWGAMFIPRIGHEVLVDFIEGDPDRPIITGHVYHANNIVPYSLPEHKTKTTIRSESSPGGGGFNELRFEDRKGAEQVFIHAQRDADTCVRNDYRESVLHDKHETVGAVDAGEKIGDLRTQVYRDQHVTVHRHVEHRIGGNVKLHVGGIDGEGDTDLVVDGVQRQTLRQTAHLHVEGERRERVDGMYFLHVGDMHVLIDGDLHIRGPRLVVEATEALSLQGGGSFVHIDGAGVAIQGPMIWMNSGKSTIAGAMDPATVIEDARLAEPKLSAAAEGVARSFLDVQLVTIHGDPIPNLDVKVRVGGVEQALKTDSEGRLELQNVDSGLARLDFLQHFPIKRIKRE